MKTRTDIHAGADQLTACQQQKDYWKNQYYHMQNVLATCQTPSPAPNPVPQPVNYGGGYVGGVWYPDQSGICG